MSTRIPCALVVACLLLAAGLFAGQANVQNFAAARALSSRGLTSPVDQGRPGSLSPKDLGIMYDNDVGVWGIISPGDYAGFGDRVLPRGRVANFGSQAQTDIAVICVIYDSAAGARVYGPETVDVARLDSGEVRTVTFPFWDAPKQEKVYFCRVPLKIDPPVPSKTDPPGRLFLVLPGPLDGTGGKVDFSASTDHCPLSERPGQEHQRDRSRPGVVTQYSTPVSA